MRERECVMWVVTGEAECAVSGMCECGTGSV